MTYKSLSFDQREIIESIKDLHCPEGFDADITYGNGAFWDGDEPPFVSDITPLKPHVVAADSRTLPLGCGAIGSIAFDPPFLTYIRSGRSGNGKMAMANRFGGYWKYSELEEHYKETLDECYRVLRDGGVLMFKCQDIVHNHKLHATHILATQWAFDAGFRLADLFVLGANKRMPSPNRNGKQRHARIFHSYFLVFKK